MERDLDAKTRRSTKKKRFNRDEWDEWDKREAGRRGEKLMLAFRHPVNPIHPCYTQRQKFRRMTDGEGCRLQAAGYRKRPTDRRCAAGLVARRESAAPVACSL